MDWHLGGELARIQISGPRFRGLAARLFNGLLFGGLQHGLDDAGEGAAHGGSSLGRVAITERKRDIAMLGQTHFRGYAANGIVGMLDLFDFSSKPLQPFYRVDDRGILGRPGDRKVELTIRILM